MRRSVILLSMALAGCATQSPDRAGPEHQPAVLAEGISCVPFARSLSGIALAGNAHQWWDAADGRYRRGSTPKPGAVLVMRRSRALPLGHLAVVVAQAGPREVLVTHANWGSGTGRGRVAENQRVVDVSRGNDWSAVRVWHPPTQSLGLTVFPAHGFIHPQRPEDPARIAARVPVAARASAGTL